MLIFNWDNHFKLCIKKKKKKEEEEEEEEEEHKSMKKKLKKERVNEVMNSTYWINHKKIL